MSWEICRKTALFAELSSEKGAQRVIGADSDDNSLIATLYLYVKWKNTRGIYMSLILTFTLTAHARHCIVICYHNGMLCMRRYKLTAVLYIMKSTEAYSTPGTRPVLLYSQLTCSTLRTCTSQLKLLGSQLTTLPPATAVVLGLYQEIHVNRTLLSLKLKHCCLCWSWNSCNRHTHTHYNPRMRMC